MGSWVRFFRSSIGKKYIMGLSGLVWIGFIAGHMLGNMTVFLGGDVYNAYGHAIVSNKPLLYGAEAVLVGSILLHVVMAMLITKENRAARPEGYAVAPSGKKASSVASKTMIYTGTVVLAFIIYHLITFKYGPHYDTEVNGVKMRDLFRLMVEVFKNPLYVIGYSISLVLLFLHVRHGFQAAFQSLGFRHPRYVCALKGAAFAYAVVVIGGFLSQPIYLFLFGG